ncbi:MAG: protein kinase [Clostridium sp.]|nr:protein kinase [Clostridium sp.]
MRGNDETQTFVRKIIKGQHPVYLTLQNCKHPFLSKLYDVSVSKSSTMVIEEYLDDESLESAELSEKQLTAALKEVCSVLEYLHGKNIIHRDIKPSNIILAKDGHIRLIDFDAARMFKNKSTLFTRLAE